MASKVGITIPSCGENITFPGSRLQTGELTEEVVQFASLKPLLSSLQKTI